MLVVSRKASLQIKDYSDDLQVRIFCMRIDNMYDHISNAAFTLALHLKLNSKFYSIFQGSEITNIDKYIDDAILMNMPTVRIIHGKGTGALRKGIHVYLRKHPNIRTFRVGTFGEGEEGVTIAELK